MTSSEIHWIIFVAWPRLSGKNWKLFTKPCMPCSSNAFRCLLPGPCATPSSTVLNVDAEPAPSGRDVDVDGGAISCVATRKTFDTAMRIVGLFEFANVSLTLSCRLSYLRAQVFQQHYTRTVRMKALTPFR